MKFGTYKTQPTTSRNRKHWRIPLANGLVGSVTENGYGDSTRPYEIAVLRDGKVAYDTPVTGPEGVIGWLTADQVGETLAQIENLPAKGTDQ